MGENKSTPASTASLVLGIISIVGSCMWYIGGICGILAIILGVSGMKKTGKKAGLVCGIIGVSVCAMLYVTTFIILTFAL